VIGKVESLTFALAICHTLDVQADVALLGLRRDELDDIFLTSELQLLLPEVVCYYGLQFLVLVIVCGLLVNQSLVSVLEPLHIALDSELCICVCSS
jgi:hypothetical protein